MRLLHLSDLHLSRYGESLTWTQRSQDEVGWQPVLTWKRWQVEGQLDRKGRRRRIRLVDPGGVVHWSRSWPRSGGDKVVSAMLSRALKRHSTSAAALVADRPDDEDLGALLRVDGQNTNLRFLQVVDFVRELEPELIAITGDLTENGFGYPLIGHYLGPWIERGRLLVVPGNHDTYDMVPLRGRRARAAAKGGQYRAFARRVGMAGGRAGAWFRRIDDLAVVGVNSCTPPGGVMSATGEVDKAQLEWLARVARLRAFRHARLRLALVHHHLLRMPFEFGKRSPFELGLRLRNAAEVMQACTQVGFDIVLNGHRHHGYTVKLPGFPSVVSAPSSTLGCESSGKRYGWLLDLAAPGRMAEAVDLPAVEVTPQPEA